LLVLLAPSISERHRNSSNENHRSNHRTIAVVSNIWAVSFRRNCASGVVVSLQALKNVKAIEEKFLPDRNHAECANHRSAPNESLTIRAWAKPRVIGYPLYDLHAAHLVDPSTLCIR
jgi:hypothetical protein